MLALRISKELEEKLEFWSKKQDRSKSYYVKKALEKLFEEEELNEVAKKAYETYLKSGKKLILLKKSWQEMVSERVQSSAKLKIQN